MIAMTQEKKQLLKIDICARLPYGIKYYDGIHQDIRGIEAYHSNAYSAWTGEEAPDNFLAICRILELYIDKPILRPLSDLYAEITHAGYNDGKPFVPLIECAKIFDPEVDWRLERIGEYEYRAIDDEDRYFGYSSGEFYHYIWGGYGCSQYLVFDLLNSLMIDYRGLIGLGLAKSVHDLDKNPYE